MLPIALRIVCASLLTASLAACQAPPHRSPSSGGPGGQPP
ncbi:hypothetical protein Y695_04873 [Hydrogenophaga sp. T4]|nr:hypothetical protein Y695_04873 [Hydrogenophaga sp. T4]